MKTITRMDLTDGAPSMWPPRHAVITGASSGVGRAMAIQLSARDVRLSLAGRDEGRLGEVAFACRGRGAKVDLIAVDVRDRAGMGKAMLEAHGRQPVDLLIANAGVSGGTDGDARAIIGINISGMLNTVEPLIEPMIARGEGQIAMMSSLAGFKSFPNAPLYCASKAAVRSYGEALDARLRARGVAVSVLCPGFMKTPLTDANDFPMPFMVSAEEGARRLLAGIRKRKSRIAFPWPVYATVRLLEFLPAGWSASILARSAGKRSYKE